MVNFNIRLSNNVMFTPFPSIYVRHTFNTSSVSSHIIRMPLFIVFINDCHGLFNLIFSLKYSCCKTKIRDKEIFLTYSIPIVSFSEYVTTCIFFEINNFICPCTLVSSEMKTETIYFN